MKEDYEFTILYDLHESRITEEGEEWRLKKKNCQRKWFVNNLDNITDLREIPTERGKIYKSKCEVFNRQDNKWIIVKGNYEDIKEVLKIENRKRVRGFYGS